MLVKTDRRHAVAFARGRYRVRSVLHDSVVACRSPSARRRWKLRNGRSWQRRTPCKAACSHQLPCFCAHCRHWHSALTCCIGLGRLSPRSVDSVLERSNIQMQGAWHSSIEEIQYNHRAHRRLRIITLRDRRKLCSKSMLRRFTVRHEPPNILYIPK